MVRVLGITHPPAPIPRSGFVLRPNQAVPVGAAYVRCGREQLLQERVYKRRLPVVRPHRHAPGMFVVSETDAAAIRAAFDQGARAVRRGGTPPVVPRTIAGSTPLPVAPRPARRVRPERAPPAGAGSRRSTAVIRASPLLDRCCCPRFREAAVRVHWRLQRLHRNRGRISAKAPRMRRLRRRGSFRKKRPS